jgi:Zn-dependent oligopeptidase
LVNGIISRSDISSQAGIATKRDFSEAPALLMQNWCRQYESFKPVTRHYKTGASMPEELFNKMINAKKFDESLNCLSELNFSVVDLTFV